MCSCILSASTARAMFIDTEPLKTRTRIGFFAEHPRPHVASVAFVVESEQAYAQDKDKGSYTTELPAVEVSPPRPRRSRGVRGGRNSRRPPR